MAGIKITGIGGSKGEKSVTNFDLAKTVDTSDEWIRSKTGIVSRYFAGERTNADMALEAGKKAMKDADAKPQEIGLLIVCTFTPDDRTPGVACEVSGRLGLSENALCLDVNGACSGFIYGCILANGFLSSRTGAKKALVIGSEKISPLLNMDDRSTCVLFGDGAGAAVVRRDERKLYLPAAHTDGAKGEALTCQSRCEANGLTREMDPEAMVDEAHFMQMDGQAVFKFAVKRVPEVIREVLERNHLEAKDIDYYIVHQANKRIIESVAKRLGEPVEKFPMNLQEYGNTSSASIPILLDELNRAGTLKSGQRLVLAGFGAGLTWGANIIDWR